MWREKLRQVEALARAVDAQSNSSCRQAEDALLPTSADANGAAQLMQPLVAFLDDDEPLVAFAALRHLEQHVRSTSDQAAQHTELLVALLLPTTTNDAPMHRWTASSGYRFQLLRTLTQQTANGTTAGDTSASSNSDGEDEAEATSVSPGLRALLRHMALLRAIAIAFFQGDDSAEQFVRSTLAYELLSLLTDITEQLTVVAEALSDEAKEVRAAVDVSGFYELSAALMDAFSNSSFALAAQPTYVSCAAVRFFCQFLRFLDASASDGADHASIKNEWLRRYLHLVVAEQSPLTTLALELLSTPESSEVSAQASFVSPDSRFPFLQSWISFAGALALAIATSPAKARLDFASVINGNFHRPSLPDRATLLAVLSEQDDVMVEVLNTLLQLTVVAECHEKAPRSGGGEFAWLAEYLCEELDPDLLFADILGTFGHDHLVLLDLLISSETVMLEYLLRYLRRLAGNWLASRALLSRKKSPQSVDALLAVLIRLRLEIDKQVAAGMFPYNAAPLLRRLLRVEELYESV